MVVTGSDVGLSRKAMALADATPHYPMYFTAGVHPHNAKVIEPAIHI